MDCGKVSEVYKEICWAAEVRCRILLQGDFIMFQNTSYVDFDFTIRAPLTRRPPAGHVCRHFRQMYLPSAQLLLHLLLSHLLHVIIPFDMSAADIESGKRLEFLYLQRAGAGARSLCIPAVTSSFEWSGRQVATLAKSGGIIYILSVQEIPVVSIYYAN